MGNELWEHKSQLGVVKDSVTEAERDIRLIGEIGHVHYAPFSAKIPVEFVWDLWKSRFISKWLRLSLKRFMPARVKYKKDGISLTLFVMNN